VSWALGRDCAESFLTAERARRQVPPAKDQLSNPFFQFQFSIFLLFSALYPLTLGTNYLGSLLPLSGAISSSLQYAPNAGDVVHLWSAHGIQFFNSYTNTNSTAGGWSPSQPGISVGEGFILDAAQTNVWVQDAYPCVWATNFIILVPAYPLWTDTGLSVESNGTITIIASGSWSGGQGPVGPRGS
jgi:hypothetical protein